MSTENKYYQLETFTGREEEILHLLAQGYSNKQIAGELFIEETTVKWYNARIYGKLDVKNRQQAVIRARTLGILERDTSDPIQRVEHNLPFDPIPFIGRLADIQQLLRHLNNEAIRLVTILGPGGMGKTRLSIEVGRRSLVQFRDGVYFVSLAPVTARDGIVTTIANTIGCRLVENTEPEDQLIDYLKVRNLLIICDNVEHLLPSINLLTTLLVSAPNVKILATSREKLQLGGEIVYTISGLSTPDKIHHDFQDTDSVRLFNDVAQRVPYPITDTEMPKVARICQMLGGMPLGILLAAAWLDTLSLTDIIQELQFGLAILESELRDAPPRHHSIEAVFEHSWKRLTITEQQVFMKLSIFKDGFTLDAARSVMGASIHDLKNLVHASFIRRSLDDRYTVHELMRQYGEQKLRDSDQLDQTKNQARAVFF